MKFEVNKTAKLKKFPGKGGWTYAEIQEIGQNKDNPFGWVQVSGFIDDYELKQYKLMPMGNGKLFLPVKAQIRKKILKEAGDLVQIRIKIDESLTELPQYILDCFQNEDEVLLKNFYSFTDGEQRTYINWIDSAKTEEAKVERIATMMLKLEKKLKFQDKLITDD